MMRSFLERLLLFMAFCFAWPMVKLYHLTCRVEHQGPLLDYLENNKPVLFAWWHQDMLFNFAYLTRFASKRKIATIISHSKDGEIAAYMVKKFGIIPVRGSSSRGGREALAELESLVEKENAVGVIVCDGPRPPARVAKFGIVTLGWKTGLPIIPVRSWGKRQHLFKKSWPKLAFVFPFSRVLLLSGEPIRVPSQISREGLEDYRRRVEDNLNQLADRSERYFV
jgi:lysophospholipid acyltransferase (LPLAT)-like uncharacterized protein